MTKNREDRIVGTVKGATIRRRDVMRAGLAGASLAAVAGLPTQARAQKAEFRFRMQSFLGPGTVEWETLVPRYIKRVNEMSNGRVEIQAFPPGALVPTFEMLDAVGKGVVEIGYGAQPYWRGKIPFTLWTWGIPGAFKVLDQYDYLWHEAGLIEQVRDAFAKHNAYFLGPVYSDEWGSTMSRSEIKTLDDFKGLKVRSFGLGAEVLKSKGASIVTIPGEEQYTALSTGVIDATNWGSPSGMYQYKLHETAKFYLSPSMIAFDMEDMFMNMRAFNRLPKDLQEIMKLCTRVYAFERAATSTAESAKSIEPMKQAGVKFTRLPDADVEYYEKTANEALERLQSKDEPTQKVLKIIFETRDLFRKRPSSV